MCHRRPAACLSSGHCTSFPPRIFRAPLVALLCYYPKKGQRPYNNSSRKQPYTSVYSRAGQAACYFPIGTNGSLLQRQRIEEKQGPEKRLVSCVHPWMDNIKIRSLSGGDVRIEEHTGRLLLFSSLLLVSRLRSWRSRLLWLPSPDRVSQLWSLADSYLHAVSDHHVWQTPQQQ